MFPHGSSARRVQLPIEGADPQSQAKRMPSFFDKYGQTRPLASLHLVKISRLLAKHACRFLVRPGSKVSFLSLRHLGKSKIRPTIEGRLDSWIA